jgi:hypothetical protein
MGYLEDILTVYGDSSGSQTVLFRLACQWLFHPIFQLSDSGTRDLSLDIQYMGFYLRARTAHPPFI